ncbi:hypothetical protein [Flavobacterium sp. N502536]|uniref:hypothetical protein n=1 Tax=Flavobacterium sp. N502536 TaxID=2986837 RepID=UPI0022239142|nr:hypothetical protein [Flavobacterium sp. N502536]
MNLINKKIELRKLRNLSDLFLVCILWFGIVFLTKIYAQTQVISSTATPDFIITNDPSFPGISEYGYYIIPELADKTNLVQGFKAEVTFDDLFFNITPGSINELFGIGLYDGTKLTHLINVKVKDEQLLIYRAFKGINQDLALTPSWNQHMISYDRALNLTFRLSIDSFSMKIYVYNPQKYDPTMQTCELLFWGMMASYTKELIMTNTGKPVLILPYNREYFEEATFTKTGPINTSPPDANAVTGGPVPNN